MDWLSRAWSRHAFAGAPPVQSSAGIWPLAAVLLAAMLLFFCRLHTPLLEPEETRYAEVPRQMLAANQWLDPVLHGEPFLDKPPLFYWLLMGCYELFGAREWSARLLMACLGCATVALTYGWGLRTSGQRTAFLAAAMLVLAPEFIYRGRMVCLDNLLGLCVTGSLAAAHIALNAPSLQRRWWWLAALAAGLGAMTKGPLAYALIGPPLLAWIVLDERFARVRWSDWLAFAGIALAVPLPWFAYIARAHPQFAGHFFLFMNVRRYVDPFDHAAPWWYYAPYALGGTLPWSLLLLPMGRFLLRQNPRTAQRRTGALGAYLIAAGWMLLFFSLSGSKRPYYILPAYPALALALGAYLDAALPVQRWAGWWTAVLSYRSRWACASAVAIAAAGILFGGLALAADVGSDALGWGLLCGSAIALGAVLAVRRRATWALAGALGFVLAWVGTHELLPEYAQRYSVRRFARSMQPLAAADAPIYSYPRRWNGLSFQLQRSDIRAFRPAEREQLIAALEREPRALLVVKADRTLEELLRALPEHLEFVEQYSESGLAVGNVRRRTLAE